MDPLVRWAALGELIRAEETRRHWLIGAAHHDSENPGLVPTAKQRVVQVLMSEKTRALIRHDRILRGE